MRKKNGIWLLYMQFPLISLVSQQFTWCLCLCGVVYITLELCSWFWASCFDTMCMRLFNNKTECQGNSKPPLHLLLKLWSSVQARLHSGAVNELLTVERDTRFCYLRGQEDRASDTDAQFNSAVNVSDAQRCLSNTIFFFSSPSSRKKLIEPLLETNGRK